MVRETVSISHTLLVSQSFSVQVDTLFSFCYFVIAVVVVVFVFVVVIVVVVVVGPAQGSEHLIRGGDRRW